MQKHFFLVIFFTLLLINTLPAQAANMSGAECKKNFPGSDCDLVGCFDGEVNHGGCGIASSCCGPIALFTETVCEQSPKIGGQGGTCKVANPPNFGCESGTQKGVGMCSDTLVDNACCVPVNPDGSLNPGMSEEECSKAVSQGGLGGNCGVDDGSCERNNGTVVGGCTELPGGADQVCCVTEESKKTAEEESGVATVGDVNIGTKYTPLENIPFIQGSTFQSYVEGLYTLALILIVLGAVFMLVIGGFTYLTSAGNTHQMGSAKEIVYGALFGLVLALVSYIIMNTINPDLVNLNVSSFQPLAGGAPGGTATSSLSAQEAAKKLLASPNVTALSNYPFTTSCNETTTTTAKANLQQVADGKGMNRCSCGGGGNVAASETLLNSLVDMADAGAKFQINVIAGACHTGSTSNHYKGTSADLQRTPGSALDAFFTKYPKTTCQGSKVGYKVSGVVVCFENSDHYHISPTGN